MLSVHETPNIFDDPHWELIFCNKWRPETSEISIPPELALETLFHAWHGSLKLPCLTTPVFLRVDGEASWLLLPSSVSVLSGGTVQPENTCSCILKVTGHVWESQKRISINTNHSYHQCSSPLASLDWSSNKIRFSFNQPNRKRWRVRLVDVINHLPLKVFLLWKHH